MLLFLSKQLFFVVIELQAEFSLLPLKWVIFSLESKDMEKPQIIFLTVSLLLL